MKVVQEETQQSCIISATFNPAAPCHLVGKAPPKSELDFPDQNLMKTFRPGGGKEHQ
jgi:hypothetical protein